MSAQSAELILASCRQAALTLQTAPPINGNIEFRHRLAETFMAVLDSPVAHHAATQAQNTLSLLLQRNKRDNRSLSRFAHGWNDMHGSSDLVGILALRMHQQNAHQAAGKMMEIIADDIGAHGSPHRDLFARFANTICCPESWRHNNTRIKACTQFRAYLRDTRTHQPLETATMVTACSEIWNVGEYTVFAPHMQPWLRKSFAVDKNTARRAAAYVQVHAGKTELQHFHFAIAARELLAKERGMPLNPAAEAAAAGSIMTRYLDELGKGFSGLHAALRPTLT